MELRIHTIETFEAALKLVTEHPLEVLGDNEDAFNFLTRVKEALNSGLEINIINGRQYFGYTVTQALEEYSMDMKHKMEEQLCQAPEEFLKSNSSSQENSRTSQKLKSHQPTVVSSDIKESQEECIDLQDVGTWEDLVDQETWLSSSPAKAQTTDQPNSHINDGIENFQKPRLKSDTPKSLKIITWIIWAMTGAGSLLMQVLQHLGIISI